MTLLSGTIAACTIGDVDAAKSSLNGENSAPKPDEPPVLNVEDGDTEVDPIEPITVKGTPEQLKGLTMVNESGNEVESKLSADGTQWSSAEDLGYGRTYTITMPGYKDTTTTFTTVSPTATTTVSLGPLEDSTVGVGQAVIVIFSSAPSDRKAVEESIQVNTSNGTEGAFYWIGPRELRWRPKDFWKPGTQVEVVADLYGKDLGDGLYASADNSTRFTIGDDVRAIVDDSTKTMEVYKNGELLRSIPVSLGRDTSRWATPNGTYVVGDEHAQLMMDSETFGLPHENGGYQTKVDYATQLSYSGIYVHAAPWSNWAQGNTNQSHGCINVTTEAAGWFQGVVKRGDPVIIKNTIGGTLPGWDGLGYWNIDWETWKAGNASAA
ncbi:transpeptidase [Corynebacterium tapiri]|uniref:Transpeptidase n=1 Tax=Corynebacterium tapiri TaxID=1448266 RepID=A0A5C4U294_9CORY|nr:transpeptidase [Corynebacterium tapiri]